MDAARGRLGHDLGGAQVVGAGDDRLRLGRVVQLVELANVGTPEYMFAKWARSSIGAREAHDLGGRACQGTFQQPPEVEVLPADKRETDPGSAITSFLVHGFV